MRKQGSEEYFYLVSWTLLELVTISVRFSIRVTLSFNQYIFGAGYACTSTTKFLTSCRLTASRGLNWGSRWTKPLSVNEKALCKQRCAALFQNGVFQCVNNFWTLKSDYTMNCNDYFLIFLNLLGCMPSSTFIIPCVFHWCLRNGQGVNQLLRWDFDIIKFYQTFFFL